MGKFHLHAAPGATRLKGRRQLSHMHDDSPLLPRQRSCTSFGQVGNTFLFFLTVSLSWWAAESLDLKTVSHFCSLMCCACFVYDAKRLNKKMNKSVVDIEGSREVAWRRRDDGVTGLAQSHSQNFLNTIVPVCTSIKLLTWRWKSFYFFFNYSLVTIQLSNT